jgi:hypothetical protein
VYILLRKIKGLILCFWKYLIQKFGATTHDFG